MTPIDAFLLIIGINLIIAGVIGLIICLILFLIFTVFSKIYYKFKPKRWRTYDLYSRFCRRKQNSLNWWR